MTKKELKNKALEMHRATVADFEKLLAIYTQESDIDENATHDPEDLSHQDEATVMRRNTELQLHQAQAELDLLEKVDISPKDKVEIGALVQTNKATFFVSVSTDAIDYKGEKIYGISTEAPLYKAMQGKKVGDTFQYGEHHYEVKGIS